MGWLQLPLMIVFVGSGVLMILLILVQSSRGTGLAGMMGGGSDRSAFGTKTGSMLSKVTVTLAVLFMVSALGYGLAGKKAAPKEENPAPPAAGAPESPDETDTETP